MTEKLKGFFALLLAAIVFSTFGYLIRELDKMFTEYGQVVVRSFFAALLALIIIIWKRSNLTIAKEDRLKMLLFALSFPVAVIFFTFSVTTTKVANSLFTLYVGSIISSITLGRLLFKETLDWQKIAALVFVLAGLFVFAYPFNASSITFGLITGLISGLADGSANALRKLLKVYPREKLLFFQYGTGTILALVLTVLSADKLYDNWQISSLVVAVIFGIGLIAIGYLLLYGFSKVDVNIGTVVLATEIFFAILLNYFLLNEVATQREIVAGVLIFAGACVVGIEQSRLKSIFKRRPT